MPNPLVQSILIGLYVLILVGLIVVAPRLIRRVVLARQTPWFRSGPSGAEADLLDRVRALEARLARLEAERSARPVRAATTVDRRTDSGEAWPAGRRPSRRDDGPILIAIPDLASPGVRSAAEAMAEFDRRFGAVWTLADEGLSDEEIAGRTGYPAGQVELILGLRRPAGAPPPPRAAPTPVPAPVPAPHLPRGDDSDA